MPTGWSTLKTYVIIHEQVGGVTNGRFDVEVRSSLGRKVVMTPPPHVSGMLVDVLDPYLVGVAHGQIPAVVNPNTFWGILDWKKRDDCSLAPTIFRTTAGVRRRIATVEMAQVMDFPVCRTERMKETDLSLLIDGDVPGRVIQGAIHFLARWKLRIETPPLVKRYIEDSEEQPTSQRA